MLFIDTVRLCLDNCLDHETSLNMSHNTSLSLGTSSTQGKCWPQIIITFFGFMTSCRIPCIQCRGHGMCLCKSQLIRLDKGRMPFAGLCQIILSGLSQHFATTSVEVCFYCLLKSSCFSLVVQRYFCRALPEPHLRCCSVVVIGKDLVISLRLFTHFP